MGKLKNAILSLDSYVLWRLSLPVTSWVDFRFGINPWRLASYFMVATCVQLILMCGTLSDGVPFKVFAMAINLPILIFRALDIKRFGKISAYYERHRGMNQLPYEAYQYLIGFDRPFYLLTWALVLLPLDIVVGSAAIISATSTYEVIRNCLQIIGNQWWLTTTIALYFASMPPRDGKRKEKKQEAPSGAGLVRLPI